MDELKFKVLCELGKNYFKLGKIKEAKINFEKALEENPESEEPLVGLAKVFLKNGNLKKAIEYVEKAKHINDNNIEIYEVLGEISLLENDFEKAYNFALQVLEKDNDNVNVNVNALIVLQKASYNLEKYEDLEKYLKIFHSKFPSDINLLYSLAGCFYLQDKLEEAKKYVEKLLIIDKNNTKAKDLLSIINKKLEVIKEV